MIFYPETVNNTMKWEVRLMDRFRVVPEMGNVIRKIPHRKSDMLLKRLYYFNNMLLLSI